MSKNHREFDILNNNFKQDNEVRVKEEIDRETDHVYQKYWKTHNYDPIFGKFYDHNKEEEFQHSRIMEQKEHGKDANDVLPPSYVHREPLIIDYSKPLP